MMCGVGHTLRMFFAKLQLLSARSGIALGEFLAVLAALCRFDPIAQA